MVGAHGTARQEVQDSSVVVVMEEAAEDLQDECKEAEQEAPPLADGIVTPVVIFAGHRKEGVADGASSRVSVADNCPQELEVPYFDAGEGRVTLMETERNIHSESAQADCYRLGRGYVRNHIFVHRQAYQVHYDWPAMALPSFS